MQTEPAFTEKLSEWLRAIWQGIFGSDSNTTQSALLLPALVIMFIVLVMAIRRKDQIPARRRLCAILGSSFGAMAFLHWILAIPILAASLEPGHELFFKYLEIINYIAIFCLTISLALFAISAMSVESQAGEAE